MRAKEIQEDYDRLATKGLSSVGKLLGDAGEPFDRELNQMLSWTRKQLGGVPEFAVWMAEALAWARYARRDDAFFAVAAKFIESGDPELLDEAVDHATASGPTDFATRSQPSRDGTTRCARHCQRSRPSRCGGRHSKSGRFALPKR